jgi:hypothetical protein
LFFDEETIKIFGGYPKGNYIDIKNLVYKIKKEQAQGISIFQTITLSNENEFIGFFV